MKTRLFSVFVLVTGLALLLAWSATAQAPSETVSAPSTNDAVSVPASQSYGNPAAVTGVGQNIAFVPDRLIVKFRAEAQPQAGRLASRGMGRNPVNNFLARQQVQSVKALFPTYNPSRQANAQFDPGLERIYRLQLQPGSDELQIANTLAADPRVEWVEPDYIARAAIIPDDPLYSGQWGLDKIQAPAAWDVVTGTATVAIAIIDSGIDQTHTDLSGQLWVNPGEIPANGLDDDNNGYVDDVNGWDFVNDDNDPADDNGHGTQVAGIAAASTGNGTGVAGVCWNCQIMPVKVMQASGIANYSDIAQGVIYAAEKGAKVINISLGGYSNSSALRSAIQTAVNDYGVVVVGGAGNDNLSAPFYPAAYAEVLAVAATTLTDTKAVFSDYGSWVDVSAPGQSITTTFLGGDWGPANGTSFAAPFVSGLAGLIRSLNTDWSADEVRAQIIQTTDDIDGLNPTYANQLGSGRINARQAITISPQPHLFSVGYTANGEPNGRPDRGEIVNLLVELSNDWFGANNVQGSLSTSDSNATVTTSSANFGPIETYTNRQNTTPFIFEVNQNAPFNHAIVFNLSLTASGGYSATVPITVTTANGIESVSGVINTDTTWTNDKTYLMTGNILVQPGVTLTIEAGTIVMVDGSYLLRVDGVLLAKGTEDAPIRFTSNQPYPAPGDWIGIQPYYGGWAEFEHCEIAYAEGAISLQGDGSVSSILRCYIHHNNEGVAGNDTSGTLTLEENDIIYNESYGVGFPGPSAIIRRNKIAYNGGNGIEASTALAIGTVTENLIHHNGGSGLYDGYGIFGGPGMVMSNTIIFNDYGVGFEDPSNTTFSHNNLWGNRLYDVDNSASGNTQNLSIPYNWWGTTDTALIDQHIYDFFDDFDLGLVSYTPILTAPDPSAPPFLANLIILPADPVGIQQATFVLTFSTAMDQNTSPSVTFGATEPYTSFVVLDNAQWVNDRIWQATYDMTSLVPRGAYTISVSGIRGATSIISGTTMLPEEGGTSALPALERGMEIPLDTRFGFIVDYAGAIGDTTPPPTPTILVCGAVSADTLSASWLANDPDSSIDRYRYAIGTTAGGADVVNWTETTDTSFLRANLNLTAGQTYYVSVKARNEGGLWSEAGVSSGVQAGSGTCPGVSFTADPVSGPVTLNVQFTDTSTGTVDSWAWDFGDGMTGTLQSPLHAYPTTGSYTVSLLVSGPGGSNWVVKPNFISVTGAITSLVAGFAASPLAGPPPLTVAFTDTSTGDINTWQWDFGNGQGNTTQNPTHIYSNTGSFTVSLTVTGTGGSDIETKPAYIIVSDNPVIANFTANPTGGQAPLTVHFNDASAGNITAWLWDFGDQTTGTLQIPGHTYTSAGVYTVSLTVSGPEGSDSLVRPNYISVTDLQFVYLPLILK